MTIDRLIKRFDEALHIIFPPLNRNAVRMNPAASLKKDALDKNQKKTAAALMRVNHAGEVCAQALYQGQALTAKLTHIKKQMQESAAEEIDHLAWCEQRLSELGSEPSLFNPLWYSGSFLMGALAGLMGDKFSLGFVMETELQVSKHLQMHLKSLPKNDRKSKKILQQMQDDEVQHAETAREAGGQELPLFVKKLMSKVAKIMTTTSYYI